MSILGCYRTALADVARLRIADGLGLDWACSTFNIETDRPEAAARIEAALAAQGIATRRWYGQGLHAHPAFSRAPRDPTPVTDHLAACTLGLPCWPGLEAATIVRIADVVRDVVGAAPSAEARPRRSRRAA